MKRKKNMISKAVVLLMTTLMVLSTITNVMANTSAEPEVVAAPENTHIILDFDGETPFREIPHKVTGNPRELADSSFDGETPTRDTFIFEQTVPATGSITALSILEANGFIGADNFFGLPSNAMIQTVSFIGLASYYSDGWQVCDPDELEFTIKFYSQSSSDHSMPPDDLVGTFDFAIGEYTFEVKPGSFGDEVIYEWFFDLPSGVALGDGWMTITETVGGNHGCCWIQSNDGDSFCHVIGSTSHNFDLAFTLSGDTYFICEPGVCDLSIDNINNFADGDVINSIPKNINMTISNWGEIPIVDAKILVNIYEIGNCEVNTTFDDDLESYNPFTQDNNVNWTPIDNGDGDTWTLYCDDSHSPIQSYRCTKGKYRDPCDTEDVYLGHAANSEPDILQMDNPLDIAGTACTTISFWHKCTGEYRMDGDDDVVPFDYGTLEYSLDAGATWSEVSGFVAYDNPWQEITVTIADPVHGLVCNMCDEDNVDYFVEDDLTNAELCFRFVWQTDPSHEYEGWYIDDIKVQVTQTPDMSNSVWQGWQIVEIEGCVPEQFVIFPVNFVGEVGRCYQLNVIAQVFDCDDADLSNNEFTTHFCVDDIHDMSATNIVGPPVLLNGDDATYDVTVENVGSFAENLVPVHLKIAKSELIPSLSIDDDFESSPTGWLSGVFVGVRPVNLWHWSTDDASSGTHSMACYNDAKMLEPDIGCLLLPDMILDLRDEDILSSTLEFDIKWSIPDDGGWEDYFAIGFSHPDGSSILQSSFTPWHGKLGGYENNWCGPNNPGPWPTYMFQWDLLEEINELVVSYPDDYPDKQLEVYFVVSTNDNTVILNENNPEYWSGVMLDDINIKTTRISSTNNILLDTKITDALNPGESQTLTMNWNDSYYCNWMVLGETDLPGDVNPDNDTAHTETLVRDLDTDISFESVDLTGYPPESFWHMVDKHQGFDSEPTIDGYWWCGKVYSTWAGYTNNMDDSLISEQLDLNTSTSGVTFEFDTWYEFADGGDYGEIYYSSDNGTTWKYVDKFTGSSDWNVVKYTIPPSDCTDEFRIKFRMISNEKDDCSQTLDVANGWYIDDLIIRECPVYQYSVLYEGFNSRDAWTKDPAHDQSWKSVFCNSACNASPEIRLTGSPVFSGETWLELDPVDTTGYTSVGLKAFTNIHVHACSMPCEIQVRTDDGSGTWSNIVYNKVLPAHGKHQYNILTTLDASDGVGSPNFGIRFYYDGNTNRYMRWSIDNVSLGISPSLMFEDFIPDWIETRGWTLISHNTDLANGPNNDKPATWSPISSTSTVHEGNDAAWLCRDNDNHPGIAEQDEHMQSPVLSYTLSPNEILGMTFRSKNTVAYIPDIEQDLIESYNGISWNVVADLAQMAVHSTQNELFLLLPDDTQQVSFHRISPSGGSDVWVIDDMNIGVYSSEAYYTFDFEQSEAHYRANDWKTETSQAGDFWQQDVSCPWDWDGDGLAHACTGYPETGPSLNDALYTVIDLTSPDLTYAKYYFAIDYMIDGAHGCMAYVELSSNYDPSEDMAGAPANWKPIVSSGGYSDSSVFYDGWGLFDIDLTEYLGKTVTMRFRLTTPGNDRFNIQSGLNSGYWVDGSVLLFKEKPPAIDELPPMTAIVFDTSGSTPTATLLAADQAGPVVSGVASTHYILNGGTAQLYSAPITLAEGSNTVEYWSVDNVGNTETKKSGTYLVDTLPPTITITSPENGLYLFGNRLFGMSKILCIGKITIEADASDNSGINMVTFDVNGGSGYDTDGSDGYTYCFSQRSFGSVDVVATAYDNNGLTAEDSISMKVFYFRS